MSDLEARFVRYWDLKEEKRRIERELRLQEIERELEQLVPPAPKWLQRPQLAAAA